MLMFSDVDATKSNEEFVFGKDGKPLFVAGPHDRPEQTEGILRTLEKLGQGNFHYLLPFHAGSERVLRVDGGDLFKDRHGQADLDDYDEDLDDEYDETELDFADDMTGSETVDSADVRRIE